MIKLDKTHFFLAAAVAAAFVIDQVGFLLIGCVAVGLFLFKTQNNGDNTQSEESNDDYNWAEETIKEKAREKGKDPEEVKTALGQKWIRSVKGSVKDLADGLFR